MTRSSILPKARPLPAVADMVDERLAAIDRKINWLFHLSPLDNDRMWEQFVASQFSEEPHLRYPFLEIEPQAVRHELASLPIDEVEDPLLRALFAEKQKECELFSRLIESRENSAGLAISLELFGGNEAHLLGLAQRVLAQVPVRNEQDDVMVGWEEFAEAAEKWLSRMRQQSPGFSSRLIIDEDLNSHLMVHRGNLHIARSIRLPKARVEPLLAHEIGTHAVTHQNGSRQSLRLLEVGLSRYDETQEGLGVLAEYLAGYLPPSRLRVLAARVLAAGRVAHGASVVQIFEQLVTEHSLSAEQAFDIAVRARRGGGLTKDAIYLRGLDELLEHLRQGGALVSLYLGKFALPQLTLIEQLAETGWVVPARVIPDFLTGQKAERRLADARQKNIEGFFQLEPESS